MDEESIVPPIVAEDDADLAVYPTVAHLCGDIEAYGIGDFAIFDSRGYPLRGITEAYRVVALERVEGAPATPSDLLARLQKRASFTGPARLGITDVESASIEQLLAAIYAFDIQPRPPRFKWLRRGR